MRRVPFIFHVIALALACLLCLPAAAYANPTVTSVELYRGSPTSSGSTLVADLTDGSAEPELVGSSETEYYLNITVKKDSANEDAWVSVTLPWYLRYSSVPGGVGLGDDITSPVSISHTSLDQILSYTNATGASSALSTQAGTIYFHIKSGDPSVATEAGFQVSFKTVPNYHNTNTSQTWAKPDNQIKVSCGLMSGSTISTATYTVSTAAIKETRSQDVSGGFLTYGDPIVPVCSVTNDMYNPNYFTSSQMIWTGYFNYNSVFTTVEFDATYPEGMVVESITYDGLVATKSGAATTTGDMTTQHYIVSAPSGWLDDVRLITATACFPSSKFNADAGQQTMTISNLTADTWGDESDYLKTGSTELKWNLADAPASVGLSAYGCWRYDWHSREGIDQSTLLAVAQVQATGDVGSQTVTITPGSGLIIRQIVVPEFTEASTTIDITNDEGVTTKYALGDLEEAGKATKYSYTESNNGLPRAYWVIDVSKLDNVKNGRILGIEYKMGKMSQGDRALLYDSSDFPDQYYATRLALYGSDSTTANQSTTFTVTGTDAQGSSTSQTTTSIFYNQSSKKVLLDALNYTMSDTSLIAGESATVSFDIQANSYAMLLGQTTCWDEDMALFAVVPSGFEISDVTVDGEAVTPEDVTNDSSVVGNPPTDGTKIYRYNLPGSVVGYYNADGTTAGPLHVSYKITTSAVMNSATYNLKDFVFVGNGVSSDGTIHTLSSYPINHGTSVAATNTYRINNTSNPLESFSKEFTVQENKVLQVKNSMIITSNGAPLDEWLVYDADSGSGRAEVKDGYTARYKVSITNDLGSDVAGARIFVPIPKAGQDFGEAFNPEGAQQFDMSFVLDDSTQVPENWTVKYLKMNSGVSYALEHAPSTSDYEVVSDPSAADMILIECSGSFEADESHDFVFDVTSADLTDVTGATNTWNAVVSYRLGTSTLVPPAYYPESVHVEEEYGNLAGVVYEDANDNGVQDSGEEGISDVTVSATLTRTSGGASTQYVRSVTTAADGSYQISFGSADPTASSQQASATLSTASSDESFSIDVTVTNPDATTYEFSPVTTTGNNPSIVTPSSDQSQASVTLSGLSAGFSADADAGLHPVSSAKPANTISPRTGDAQAGTAGQVAAMLAGGMALVALAFALRKGGQRQ